MLTPDPSERPTAFELETDETVPISDIREPAERIADRERVRATEHPDVDAESDPTIPSPTPDTETVEAERARNALLDRYAELRARTSLRDVNVPAERMRLLRDVIAGVAPEHEETILGRRDLVAQLDTLLERQPDAATAVAALEKTVRRVAENVSEREAKSRSYRKTPSGVRVHDLPHDARAATVRKAMRPALDDITSSDENAPTLRSAERPASDEQKDGSFTGKLRRLFGGKRDAA